MADSLAVLIGTGLGKAVKQTSALRARLAEVGTHAVEASSDLAGSLKSYLPAIVRTAPAKEKPKRATKTSRPTAKRSAKRSTKSSAPEKPTARKKAARKRTARSRKNAAPRTDAG